MKKYALIAAIALVMMSVSGADAARGGKRSLAALATTPTLSVSPDPAGVISAYTLTAEGFAPGEYIVLVQGFAGGCCYSTAISAGPDGSIAVPMMTGALAGIATYSAHTETEAGGWQQVAYTTLTITGG